MGFTLIVLALIAFWILASSKSSAIHDPAGYVSDQGCGCIAGIAFLIGIILMLSTCS